MNIVARLVQVIHWFVFIPAILVLSIGLFVYIIDSDPELFESLIEWMFLDTRNLEQLFMGIVLDCTLIVPFIRYIIFGKFGWFPWTPIRKE
jgi:hypothetical protein